MKQAGIGQGSALNEFPDCRDCRGDITKVGKNAETLPLLAWAVYVTKILFMPLARTNDPFVLEL